MREERVPVIVGVGQVIDQPLQGQDGLEPLALIKKALALADADSGGAFLKRVDSLDVIKVMSWRYDNLPESIARDLQLHPTRMQEGDLSGESPVRCLAEAANRIASGESQVSVICGGESAWSVRQAAKLNNTLASWTPKPPHPAKIDNIYDDLGVKYGLDAPANIYPLYENASRHAWGQTFDQGQSESARLWSAFSKVAADYEYAWSRNWLSEEQIKTPTSENRMVAWPYTKLMIANNFVNGATAIIVTSLALAKQAQIAEDRLIYVWAGAYADEPTSYIKRDRFDHSRALEVALKETLRMNQLTSDSLDYAELYSCFCVVPKLARRALGFDENVAMTLVGGMNAGGAQFGNFMSQAAVAMVRKLRERGKFGLLYGNGHFLTHHCALVLSRLKPPEGLLPISLDQNAKANGLRSPIPKVLDVYVGEGVVETYTVLFDRMGAPETGVIIARTKKGDRFVARIDGKDKGLLLLMDPKIDPIGKRGYSIERNGINHWSFD